MIDKGSLSAVDKDRLARNHAMSPSNFDDCHNALAARFRGTPALNTGNQPVTLHLYHAPSSICSQKVRAVLSAKDQPYISHLLDIFRGETYDPAYVRLRMMGCRAAELTLANDHPGTTSVKSTGCDACVVPTVVAADSGEVLVDSRHICLELDRRNPVSPGALIPQNLRAQIDSELAVVDDLPNYQLLAVAVGKTSEGAPDNSFAVSKVRRCDALLAENAEDPTLCDAYAAKRSKEQAAAERLFDINAMSRARDQMADALRNLNARLPAKVGPYLFGDAITMADLFWGVELIRLDDLGLSRLWSDGASPKLDRYYQKLCELPALWHAVIDWPGARLKQSQAD